MSDEFANTEAAMVGYAEREDGEIETLVGTSSSDLVSAGRVVVKTAGPIEKSFDGIRHVD